MLLHDTRNDDGIKGFMQDVYDVYVKASVNHCAVVNVVGCAAGTAQCGACVLCICGGVV